jgi:anti-sigma regulatory factor (Ser/Thr protein kinase)
MPFAPDTTVLSLPCELASARYAREHIGDLALDGLDDDALERVRIVVAELVANAALHSGNAEDQYILVTLQERDRAVRVTVVDAGPGFVPSALMPDPKQDHGRGTPIVAKLARSMSVTRTDGATRVWAEIPLSP